jgi:hypothetical protein
MEETSSLEALAPFNRNSDFDRLQLVILGIRMNTNLNLHLL